MSFMSELKNQLDDKYNVSVTENGAIGYRTTTHPLLDLNFAVASLRSESEQKITKMFRSAFVEDPELAIKWLFYARDVRGGLGERRLFRVILEDLCFTYPEVADKILSLIPIYGRYDDLVQLATGEWKYRDKVVDILKAQLESDLAQMEIGRPVSLLAKWMPSVNAGRNAREAALMIADSMRLTENQYRRKLSKLRKYIDLVESHMCAGDWSGIAYSKVPSRAALIYKDAFMKHDSDRYSEYIAQVEEGSTKINAGTLYPHDIVARYSPSARVSCALDPTLEAMWKALPEVDLSGKQMLVVRDGSGSMSWQNAGKSNVNCLTVATALTIYFAERTTGEFKNKFITFSARPKLIDLLGCDTLHDKLIKTYAEDDCSNTDLYKVFTLILDTAVSANMDQSEMPENILIFSDMEFDGHKFDWYTRLFEVISDQYAQHGYKIPRLIFWNLNSRTETIPVIKNELGLVLTSGYSVQASKMIMSGELDPMKALEDILNADRYQPVSDALNKEV